MLRLIKFLLTGSWHEHEWEMEPMFTEDVDAWSPVTGSRIVTRTHWNCRICGEWTKRDLR
jgi:hypothetical protein